MPFNAFLSSLKTGHLYTFVTPKIKTPFHHHFILLGHTPDFMNFFFCNCTSQFAKRVRYVQFNGLPESTLVPLRCTSLNNLTDSDSCINCNDPIHHTRNELESIFNTSLRTPPIPVYGTLTDGDLQQIFIGTHASEKVVEWYKENIPDDIDKIKAHLRM